MSHELNMLLANERFLDRLEMTLFFGGANHGERHCAVLRTNRMPDLAKSGMMTWLWREDEEGQVE